LYAASGEGEEFAGPEFDDSGWLLTPVPAQHQGTREHPVIWYRVRFPRPQGGSRRWLLQFDGAFQSTVVWLNGVLLGQHYGYFSPFAFDITGDLADENVLTVCCESRVEWEVHGKKHPMGVFNDWDCKPYPNNARGTLPEEYPWSVPLGLWAPVRLEGAGDVVLESVQYTSTLEADGSATVLAAVRALNLTDAPATAPVSVSLASGDEQAASGACNVRLPARSARTVTLGLRVPEARLWWPWTHGEPNLYTATISVGGKAADTRRIGIRTVEYRGEETSEGPAWFINGRPIFPRGSNYISEFRLDTCTYDRHLADLQLMKDANMDFVRVHAHIEPRSFYEAADELGLLVMCDAPMIFSYVYGATPDDRVFHAWAARDQVEKMVNLLFNHPSIALWEIHNEPPWPEPMSWFGGPHRARTNYDVDNLCAARAQELDPTRPVITASGHRDTHTYGGWYSRTWLEYGKIRPRFCTEYGAQALPSIGSPFWEHVRQEWPVSLTEPSWVYADYQPTQWSRQGVGGPEGYGSLEEYVAASQKYQAWIARYGAERLRILKWRPSAGIVHFAFTDGHPAITWAVTDYHRVPKTGYYALQAAFRPTHVCIDPVGEFTGDRRGNVIFLPGAEVAFDLWLVNDDPAVSGPAALTWELSSTDLAEVVLSGTVPTAIPAFDAPAGLVAPVRWTPPAAFRGPLILRTVLRQGQAVLEESALEVRVEPAAT
jgi:beta-mannosidase